MEISLSDADIKRFDTSLNIIVYSELQNMTPIQILKKMPLVILYQSTPNTGHWTLLHKTIEGLEFFDSYGFKPDKQFEYIGYRQPHYIAKLLYILYDNGYNIHYNQYPFQESKPGINTCGRHVLVRHLLSYLPIDKYKELMDKLLTTYNVNNYDELIVKLTQSILY
jgi:hypothetical protein